MEANKHQCCFEDSPSPEQGDNRDESQTEARTQAQVQASLPPFGLSTLSGPASTKALYILVALMALLSVAVVVLPVAAFLSPLEHYQGLMVALMPLVVLSLCLSAFAIFLSLCLAKALRAGLQAGRDGAAGESPAAVQPSEHTQSPLGIDPKIPAYNMQMFQSEGDQIFLREALQTGREHGLTQREVEVLELLLQGRNAERISQSLVISRHTAKTHIYNIYKKIGSSSQQELIDLFQERISVSEEGENNARPNICGLRAS
ncbi:MAG: helix-turn-helix transcriptional regulator [Eggerthellaceae bacterium]|jgi:DNA-binding CsgD family transcriptional regulator|nr:helix-turn-helix transcriptional regulator [Eggerthellaceae bacterium]MDR2715924.1 helix-turn-helix transcriptional regulator [Coriobacteriaceae bacterium]